MGSTYASDTPVDIILTSFGVLWAAQRKIHCSVAVIWVHVSGWHSLCQNKSLKEKEGDNYSIYKGITLGQCGWCYYLSGLCGD